MKPTKTPKSSQQAKGGERPAPTPVKAAPQQTSSTKPVMGGKSSANK
ncbi:MAG: hypothetical protein OEL78_06875 [Hyphomicrobiales bacterium]|nr:hypothetical protein [Hyphomicrobiales bacterium]